MAWAMDYIECLRWIFAISEMFASWHLAELSLNPLATHDFNQPLPTPISAHTRHCHGIGSHGPQLTVDSLYTTTLGSDPRHLQLLTTSLSISPIPCARLWRTSPELSRRCWRSLLVKWSLMIGQDFVSLWRGPGRWQRLMIGHGGNLHLA